MAKKKEIFIVLHHEFFRSNAEVLVDEMVFYTASSLEKAITFIKSSYGVSEYSWWEIQKQYLDNEDHAWPEHVGWYGRKGGKLVSAAQQKCRKAFDKYEKEENGKS